MDEIITVDSGDFRERFLISDELIGNSCPDEELKFVGVGKMRLSKAKDVIIQQLKKKVYHEMPVFLVSVGSYHITASYNGWGEDIEENGVELVKEGVARFEKSLKSLRKCASKYKCKIVVCGLIQLPSEQNSDLAAKSKKILTDHVSRLFVECNKSIDKYNTRQGESTLVFKKFLDKGDKQRYPSSQRKIKMSRFTDEVHPKPTKATQSLLMNKAVERLRKL